MGIVVEIFQWIYNLLKRFVLSVVSVYGAITAAIAGFGTFLYTCVREFDESTNIIRWIDAATRGVDTLNDSIEPGSFGDVILHMFAVDSAMTALVSGIGLTFGMFLAFIGVVLVGIFTLIPTVLAAQVIMKSVKVASGGFIDP